MKLQIVSVLHLFAVHGNVFLIIVYCSPRDNFGHTIIEQMTDFLLSDPDLLFQLIIKSLNRNSKLGKYQPITPNESLNGYSYICYRISRNQKIHLSEKDVIWVLIVLTHAIYTVSATALSEMDSFIDFITALRDFCFFNHNIGNGPS